MMNEPHCKEDRISSLPDDIVCHILSFLPTKYAVATSVLSSRWKLLWIGLHNLWFDDSLCRDDSLSWGFLSNNALARFEHFVTTVLLSNSTNINKFSLHCSRLRDLNLFRLWVLFAIERNVREIELVVDLGVEYDIEVLPESICTCETLEVLKLNSHFAIPIPASGMCFPNLKILHVNMFYPDNNITLKRLFSICPVLEDLLIWGHFNIYSATNFHISSPTLKRLTLIFRKSNFTGTLFPEEREHQVVIRAPMLQHIYIRDCMPVSYVGHGLHFLTKAVLDIGFFLRGDHDWPDVLAESVVQLLEVITNIKFLYLSKRTLHALGFVSEDLFPTFSNLTHLEVEVGEIGGHLLPVMLNSTPELEAFFFEKEFYGPFVRTELRCVPRGLLSHVKTVEISGFKGQKDQLELIEHVLKNGGALSRVIIRFQRALSRETGLKEELCEKISLFQRGSETCKVEVL